MRWLAVAVLGLAACNALPTGGGASAGDQAATLEARVLEAVNELRSDRGKKTLRSHDRLVELARRHSRAMARGEVPFSHRGFERRAAALREHWPGATVAENVAFSEGYDDPAATAVESWRGSRRHRKTMLGDPWQLTGVGVERTPDGRVFVTQLFLAVPAPPD